MKVGSLVECVSELQKDETHEILPVVGRIYTVRGIDQKDGAIWLEEIVNPIELVEDERGQEIMDEINFDIEAFRELQPPITNIEEHINSNTLEKELV